MEGKTKLLVSIFVRSQSSITFPYQMTAWLTFILKAQKQVLVRKFSLKSNVSQRKGKREK